MDIEEEINLDKKKKHTVEAVVDRLVVKDTMDERLADSLETALKYGEGVVYVEIVDGETLMFSENFACVDCGISLSELTPRMFSFNNPYGACPECTGLGSHMEFDEELIVSNPELSINEGAFALLSKHPMSYAMKAIEAVLGNSKYNLSTPWKDIDKKLQKQIENIRMSLFNFVKENYRIRMAADFFCKNTPVLIAYVSRRSSN